MSDVVVILAAHGAGDNSIANASIEELAKELSHQLNLRVIAAFNLGHPTYEQALESIDASRIIVVPLMTSAGYFACDVLPRRFDDPRCSILQPIGAQDAVIAALVARTRCTLQSKHLDPADTAIVVVGHGTERSTTSGDATHKLADAIRHEIPGVIAQAAFLDQHPRVEKLAAELRTSHVIVVPFLIGGGYHASRDIAPRLEKSKRRKVDKSKVQETKDRSDPQCRLVELSACRFFHFEPPLLERPEFIKAVETSIERHARRPIRLGTRRSPLALWQARKVAAALATHTERPIELVTFDASGDLDQHTSLEELPGDSPFTDALTAALSRGEIDFATHSLKDLPLEPDDALPVVAVLERGSADEALVARDGRRLCDLPRGARIGVSCARRAVQLRHLRPDVIATPIRGPVDARIEQVLNGGYDAAILAVAGIERLGLERHITQRFSIAEMTPAAGQGAIALQARADDHAALELARRINHIPTWRAVQAELLLARMIEGADNRRIVAARAIALHNGKITLTFKVFTRDGESVIFDEVRADSPQAAAELAVKRVTNDELQVTSRLSDPRPSLDTRRSSFVTSHVEHAA